MRDAFAQTFESKLNGKAGILVTGDLGFGVFDSILERYPTNFLNAGITEQSLTSMCSGLSDEGYIPFVYSIANFPTFRNLEQIRNDIAYPNKHVVVTSVGAGLSYGTLGFSHFGVEDLAIMRSLPNFRILSPSDPLRARLATESAFEVSAPTYLRLGKNGEKNFGNPNQNHHKTVRTIFQIGHPVAVISTGSIGSKVHNLRLNGLAEFDHFSLEEMSARDDEVLRILEGYRYVIAVEEHAQVGGLYSMLSENAMEKSVKIRIKSCSVDRSRLFTAGDHTFMLDQAGLSAQSIADTINSVRDL